MVRMNRGIRILMTDLELVGKRNKRLRTECIEKRSRLIFIIFKYFIVHDPLNKKCQWQKPVK